MSSWTDHPQKFRGQLMIHRPNPIKTALVNEGGGITYPVYDISYDNEAGDTIDDYATDGQPEMHCMVTFGDAPGGREKGRTLNLGTTDSTNSIKLPNVPRGVRLGEVDIADNDTMTWWHEWRPFFLSPRYYYSGLLYYLKKGWSIGDARLYQERYPLMRMGPAFFDFAGASGYADIDFDSDGSIGPWHAMRLSGGTDQNGLTAIPTASSENGAHTVDLTYDNNNATYWESTGGTDEYIDWDFGSGPTDPKEFSYISLDCQASTYEPATFEMQWSDDGSTYTTIEWEAQTTWTSGKYYFFPPPQSTHRYWRLYLRTTNGAGTFRIHEIELFMDRAHYQGLTWDIQDGSYQTGSSSTAAITGRFYPGFRWVSLGAYWGATHIRSNHHRPACVLDTSRTWASADGLTITVSGGGGTSNLMDGDTDTGTTIDSSVPCWAQFVFPTWIELTGIKITATGTVSPNDFVVQYYDPLTAAWYTVVTAVDVTNWAGASVVTNEYTFDKPAFADTFRIYITSNNGGGSILLREVALKYRHPYGFCIEQAEVTNHTITPEGQIMEFRIYEDLSDFPPGALVMFRGDEYYNGTKGSLTTADPSSMSREGLFFHGWIDEDRTRITRTEDGRIAYTDIVVLDVAHWLVKFPGISQMGSRLKDFNATGPLTTGTSYDLAQIRYLNIDRMIIYLLFFDCVGLELADFFSSGHWETYAFPLNQAQGGNIYANADGRAQTIAHRLTFNKMGQFKVLPDPLLQAAADRTTEVQAVIGPEDIVNIQWTRFNSLRIGRHWGDGMQRSHEAVVGTNATSPLTLTGFACVAPDENVYGQGQGELDQGEQLIVDQNELNAREGNRYAARSNPATSFVEVELVHPGDNGIDPARMSWVELSVAAQYQRVKNVASGNLIGLWWLNETGGTTITDTSDTGSDGTPSNVQLNFYKGPDFEPAPHFDNTADIDIYSAALGSAFNTGAGTIMLWFRATNDILTDGNFHALIRLYIDASNSVAIYKTNTDVIAGLYFGGGNSESATFTITDTNWHHVAITWDYSADEFKVYLDGGQVDTTDTGLTALSGSLASAYIGSWDGATYFWKGGLALAAIFDAALDAAAILTCARNDAVRGPDGETFAGERFLVAQKTIEYDHEAMTRRVILILEREVEGVAAPTFAKPS